MAGYLVAAASTAGPSWLWYATRGLGVSTLIVLTGTVALGVVTSVRWTGEATPGFVPANLHRNLSLLAILLLVAHIVTTVLDPFAHITVRDVIVPFGAQYRPVWLGLGVGAAEILVAIAATSLLRQRIGPRWWRTIHWAAYSSWPLALIHGLGTGSDARSPWMIAAVTWSVAAVIVALFYRLRRGALITVPLRALAGAAAALFLVAGGSWAFNGPLAPGWSARAGTPPATPVAPASPAHPGHGGFSDSLVGVVVRDATGFVQISMRDSNDAGLTIAIRSPASNETLPVVTIARDGRAICAVPTAVSNTLYAVCGNVRLTISLFGPASFLTTGGQITGRLDTSGPL